jgi:hypothetical protein
MDPVSALSVAASVIQFVDYGTRVISKAREIYASADGTLSANSEIEEATTRLQVLSNSLRPEGGLPLGPLDEADTALDNICKECIQVSRELVCTFEKLKLPKSYKHKKWESFRRSFKGVWGKEKTKEVVERLARLRSELDTHVLVSVK